MKTTQFIDMLATGDLVIPRHVWLSRHIAALACGLTVSLLLVSLFIGLRTDIAEAAGLPMFWIKQAYPLVLALSAFVVILRLSRPGLTAGPAVWMAPLAVVALWAMALTEWFGAAPGQREALLFGQTWRECLVYVPLLSIPTFLGAFVVLRSLAPTRPVAAGAVAGFLAGCVGAFAYALHCPELTASFLGVWYLLGMLIPAGLGAMLGSSLLRW